MMGEGERVLVIVAHPDDAEFSSGGTIAKWAREGKEITYLLCTNGNKGSGDPMMTSDRLAVIREKEQRAAASVLGVKDVLYLGYNDGELVPSLTLRRDITRVIRQVRPDIVITMDPTVRFRRGTYLNHSDHRVAGDTALDAIYPAARDHLYFPELLAEGLRTHIVKEVYLTGSDQTDVWVDISDTIDLKIAALRQHVSQVGDHFDDVSQMVRMWAQTNAEGKDMKFAEVFRRLILA